MSLWNNVEFSILYLCVQFSGPITSPIHTFFTVQNLLVGNFCFSARVLKKDENATQARWMHF